jgi:hypothetical protein
MTAEKRQLPARAGQRGYVTHGIYSFLRTGKVNPSVRGFKRIQKYLREIERDLTADLGGQDSLTAAQEVLVKTTVQAYGVLLLAGAYTQRYSILDPVKARRGILELQPVLGHQYIAFLNCVRQNLIALGLDRRRVEEPLDLGRYLAQKDAEKVKDEAAGQDGDGVSKTKEGEKSPPVSTSRKGQEKDKASRVRVEGGTRGADEGVEGESTREGDLEGGGDGQKHQAGEDIASPERILGRKLGDMS